MLWDIIMLEDKSSTQTIFCCRLPEAVFQNLLVVFHFHDSFDPDEIPSTKHLHVSGDGVLWDEHLSLLTPKHRQYLYGQRAQVLSDLTKGHVSSVHNFSLGCPLNFRLGSVSNLTVHSCPGL